MKRFLLIICIAFITSINDIMAIVVYYGITLIVFAYLI